MKLHSENFNKFVWQIALKSKSSSWKTITNTLNLHKITGLHITLLIGVTKIIYTVVTFHWFFTDFGNCYVFESVDQTLNGLKEIHEKSYLLVPASSLGIIWEISSINSHLKHAIRKIKEDILKTQIQRRFQNPVKYPRRNFLQKQLTLRAVTYFHKKLHLTSQKSSLTCLNGFWIRL